MPELMIGLNDTLGNDAGGPLSIRGDQPEQVRGGGGAVALDDVTFHQCVNLSRFASDKTMSFVPPDGDFELMKYRVTEDINLPFKVLPVIREVGRTRVEVMVSIRASAFSSALEATSLVVKVPVPGHTARASITVNAGKAKYRVEESCLVWKVKRFRGQSEVQLQAEVELVRPARAQPQLNH
jgi:AP-2 complex subunit mu-1